MMPTRPRAVQARASRVARSRAAAPAVSPAALGFQTLRGSTAGDRFRLDALSSTTSGPLLIHACGYQSDENNLWQLWGNGLKWLPGLMSAGWIIGSCDFEAGESWGNEAGSQTALDALIAYADANFTVTHIVLEGLSAGGLVVLNHVTAGSYDDRIRGVILGNPVCDLAAIYAYNSGEYADSIDAAYGITNPPDYETATSGYDPVLVSASAYNTVSSLGHKLRYATWASSDDTVVDKSTHADALDTLIGSGGWESGVTTTSGSHYTEAAYGDPSEIEGFATRCVIDWPTLTGAATSGKAAASSVALTIPASTTEGDLLVACVGGEGSGMATVTMTEWTSVASSNIAGAHIYGLFYKVASAADETNAGSGTYTVSIDGTPTGVGGQMIHVTRADTSNPFGAVGGGAGGGTTSAASTGVTVDGYNRLGLAFVYASTDTTVTWPSGWTEVGETASGGAGMQVSTAVKIQPNSGVTGGFTATLGASSVYLAVETQIRPVEA